MLHCCNEHLLPFVITYILLTHNSVRYDSSAEPHHATVSTSALIVLVRMMVRLHVPRNTTRGRSNLIVTALLHANITISVPTSALPTREVVTRDLGPQYQPHRF